MIEDILTVIWKERKGLLHHRGSRTRAVLTLIVPVISIAVVMPLIMGPDWLTTGWPLMASVAFPLVVVGMTIPDSFAGERERHTLETLLASRLPDRAILLGKLGLSVVYGWITTLIILLVSATAVNVMHWASRVMFYKPGIALAHLAVSLLMSFLVAGLGILISLRAATVQGAQQALFGALLIPLSLLQFVPMLLLSVVPNGRVYIRSVLTAIESPLVIAAILVLWLIVDLTLLAAAVARFRRARLILG
jgi:ABC-2 type transport system permease protein